ncbi:MAG: hypothetical protein UX57_C0007G0050 [Candidatus Uhrbacteria bacterium GW2011_GWE2_46_68]|uniref:Uncharacterized protein n=2 Tax=Candidatus Uhriibacteriota TaxID=1752732 RepID=A0A0G1SG18_9BACT|nr:MAG: hypothetical protein UX45_C0004G0010 [Candidatus Uhrbacteria bacterium GW2011_GWF2_46_218]KKU41018.1 MAG: hypothetical protein UX57_C0007G0050 [Candidatus Uhrbacteria bacterium GW2011_GWE2_46_68]
MIIWKSELSLTEQVRYPGRREIVSTNNAQVQKFLKELNVPMVSFSAPISTGEVPALIGMRIRIHSITTCAQNDENAVLVRWSVTFSPAHEHVTRRMFARADRVRYSIQIDIEQMLLGLTAILRPEHEGGVVDIFYFLTPNHLPIMWFVPDAFEGLRYEARTAEAINRRVHATYYFFLPRSWVDPLTKRVGIPTARFFLGDRLSEKIPIPVSVPTVPLMDRWKENETREACRRLFEKQLQRPLDSLWRAIFVENPSSARELQERHGYKFQGQDHTVFDAGGKLADMMKAYERNIANLGNLTLFGG